MFADDKVSSSEAETMVSYVEIINLRVSWALERVSVE